jgi:hypothetical protein
MEIKGRLIELIKAVFQPDHPVVYGEYVESETTGIYHPVRQQIARQPVRIMHITSIPIGL